jgi:hypothetical protein
MNSEQVKAVMGKIYEAFADLPDDRDEAIKKLVTETGLSEADCATAYDNIKPILPQLKEL